MHINNVEINQSNSPYMIAELSANHGGSYDRAIKTIRAAKDAGADAVKIQSYTADSMTLNSDRDDFIIQSGLWNGWRLHDLYAEAHTPYAWHRGLFDYAKQIGITLFSSPFDEEAADILENLDCPAFKIASFEIVDLPLIRHVARKGRPVLISTGMASLDEIGAAVECCRSVGNSDILLFHCVSSYPASVAEANLSNLRYLKDNFNVEIGLSDHTITNLVASLAVGLGASAIEKHFQLDDSVSGPDSSFSVNPIQFASLVDDCRLARVAVGSKWIDRSDAEKDNLKFRRSLYFVKNLKAGAVLGPGDIRRVRPGYGLDPRYLEEIIGHRLLKDVTFGEAVTWDAIEDNVFSNRSEER